MAAQLQGRSIFLEYSGREYFSPNLKGIKWVHRPCHVLA